MGPGSSMELVLTSAPKGDPPGTGWIPVFLRSAPAFSPAHTWAERREGVRSPAAAACAVRGVGYRQGGLPLRVTPTYSGLHLGRHPQDRNRPANHAPYATCRERHGWVRDVRTRRVESDVA